MTKKEYMRENSIVIIFEGHKNGLSNDQLSFLTGVPTPDVERVLTYQSYYEATKPKKLNLLRLHESYSLLHRLQAEVLA